MLLGLKKKPFPSALPSLIAAAPLKRASLARAARRYPRAAMDGEELCRSTTPRWKAAATHEGCFADAFRRPRVITTARQPRAKSPMPSGSPT
jgi:hypothetical protein